MENPGKLSMKSGIFVLKKKQMETILIKVSRPQKVNYLIQILKSLDFVSSVDRLGKYVKTKKLLDEINTEAAKGGLS